MAWNDNHVTFNQSSEYAIGTIKIGGVGNTAVDDLFKAGDGGAADNSAFMEYGTGP